MRFEWAKLGVELFCYGKFNEVSVLVRRPKWLKSLKVGCLQPIFGDWVLFLVVVRRGWGAFRGSKSVICDLE